MANEPKYLQVNTDEKPKLEKGESGIGSASVSTEAREVLVAQEESANLNLTNVRGEATGNTEERSLRVSREVRGGQYVQGGEVKGFSRSVDEKKSIVNTITVDETKHLIALSEKGTKGYIDEIVKTIREGQYVKVDTTEYPTLEDFLDSDGEQGTVYLYPVGNEENNYYQYIWEVNTWMSLGTTELDLSNYVTTDTNQTISGVKTFSNGLKTDLINIEDYLYIRKGANNLFVLEQGSLQPSGSNTRDLGSTANTFKDLHLSGKIKDGTNEFNADNVLNVIKASDIAAGNVLTDEQIAIIKNGRITCIDGTEKIIILPGYENETQNRYSAFAFATSVYSNLEFYYAEINLTSKVLTYTRRGFLTQQKIYLDNPAINNKAWPSNPSNTGTFTLKCVDGVLTWVADN